MRLAAGAVVVALAAATGAPAEEFSIEDGDVAMLIVAIDAANNNGEPDVIHLDEGGLYTLTDEHNSSFGLNGFPWIETAITIEGHGAVIQRSDAKDTPEFRFFFLPSGTDADLTLSNLTLDGGSSSHGGAIRNWGNTVTIIDCTVSNHTAANNGGAIHSDSGGSITIHSATFIGNSAHRGGAINKHGSGGSITITESTFTNNTSATTGGAIHHGGGPLAITATTVSDNHAVDNGGGIRHGSGTMTLTNCTISSNTTGATGGGCWVGGTANITHCTVTGNATDGGSGGGILNFTSNLTLSNTIVSDNTTDDLNNGSWNDAGYNIVGDGTGVEARTSVSGDPMLGPLADNGGPTMTHALLDGSPAIDAGDCHGGDITEDQRGVARPQGNACDIGALESQDAVPGCTQDLDGDLTIGVGDLLMLLSAWGDCTQCPEDLDNDTTVGVGDLLALLSAWGPCD